MSKPNLGENFRVSMALTLEITLADLPPGQKAMTTIVAGLGGVEVNGNVITARGWYTARKILNGQAGPITFFVNEEGHRFFFNPNGPLVERFETIP